MTREDAIARVARYEELLGEVTAAHAALREAIGQFAAAQPAAQALEAYCTGEEWKRDFAADEAGLLPPELPRGVLSEDAAYDALAENDRLRAVLKALDEEE